MKQKNKIWVRWATAMATGWVAATWISAAHADEVYTFVIKKQEEKAKSHWSLQEWLDTRDRMRLMDLWLALHSSSPYEFFLGGSYRGADAGGVDGTSGSSAVHVHGGAYASIFGLDFDRSLDSSATWNVAFDVRIFGFHAQGTNITLQGGLRSRGDAISERNGFAGVASSIYLARYFGIDGLWRKHFDSVPNASGSQSSGSQWDAGAFIDFSFLRVFGKYWSLIDDRTNGVHQNASGFEVGTRVYF